MRQYALVVASLRKAIAGAPNRSYYVALAEMYLDVECPLAARACADAALSLNPSSPTARLAIAAADRLQGRDDLAFANVRAALSCASSRRTMALAQLRLADLYVDHASRDEMIKCCIRAAELDPTNVLPYFRLAHAGYYSERSHPHFDAMERLCRSRRLGREPRATIHFALGFAYDQHAHYEAAFSHFKRANDLRSPKFDARSAIRDVDRRVKAYALDRIEDLSRYGSQDDRLIVVVGMPRSGTTLVEQILDSHPQVAGLGERPEFFESTRAITRELAWARRPYPECLEYLTADSVQRVSQQTLSSLTEAVPSGARRVVTKRPGDFLDIGLIRILFPRATIIHCRRHPVDTCLSCYMQHFDEVPYASRLTHLEAYYKQYTRVMDHWNSVPEALRIIDVCYEELVQSPDSSIPMLLDACNLARDDRCFEFFKNARPVATSSVWQVRRPIYKHSVGRWKHYAPFLGPLIRLLPDDHLSRNGRLRPCVFAPGQS